MTQQFHPYQKCAACAFQQETCCRMFKGTICNTPYLEITQMLIRSKTEKYVVTHPTYSAAIRVTVYSSVQQPRQVSVTHVMLSTEETRYKNNAYCVSPRV